MLELTEKRFADYLRHKGETGMGYWVVTVVLKDGRSFPQTVVVGGVITQIRGWQSIPFTIDQIDRLEVTHDKWDWSADI